MTEYPHLRWWAKVSVFLADRKESNLIAKTLGDIRCPGLKLGAGPLEAVVAVPVGAGGQAFPDDVVLDVRGREDDRARLHEFKEDSLEGGEALGVEVLDHLDNGRRIVTFQAPVTVGERAVEQGDALALPLRHPIEMETLSGAFQYTVRDVHSRSPGRRRCERRPRATRREPRRGADRGG